MPIPFPNRLLPFPADHPPFEMQTRARLDTLDVTPTRSACLKSSLHQPLLPNSGGTGGKHTMAPRQLRIAVVQFATLPPGHGDDASAINLRRAHDFVREASKAKANLVVFPEYFIAGVIAEERHWKLAQPARHLNDVESEHVTDSWLDSFRKLAVECDIDIVTGTIVERSQEDKLYNVAHYLSRKGELLGKYVKNNLWWPEKAYLSPGDEVSKVFDTEWGRVGLLVCWDMAWPEAFRSLVLQDVEIVICPTFWTALDAEPIGLAHNPDSEQTFLDSLIVARAFENECCIVFANVGGPKEDGYIGRSAVTMPFKGVIAKAKSCEEEMVVVDVELDILKDAGKVYGIRRELKPKMKQWGILPNSHKLV